MNLVFSSPLELIAIAAVTCAVNSVVRDGETTWFEGVLLLSIYSLLALAFYFVTATMSSLAMRAGVRCTHPACPRWRQVRSPGICACSDSRGR